MNSPRQTPLPPGILLIDKPTGWTSSDVVIKLRNRFRLEKVGHGGTLDPGATGLLAILVGRQATRLSDPLMAGEKQYRATLQFGVRSDTLDLDGRVTLTGDWRCVTRDALERLLPTFRGDILQTPPMVSAIQIGGKRLYQLAREGLQIERQPRPVHIRTLTLLAFHPPRAELEIDCSKGTYIRTLCDDIGTALGCGALVADLRRTRIGPWRVEAAAPLREALAWDRQTLLQHLQPIPPELEARRLSLNHPDTRATAPARP
ncbi:MAG: tRNA pseudouridine(55) synthase TruB [Kiritimatiellia bacterium]